MKPLEASLRLNSMSCRGERAALCTLKTSKKTASFCQVFAQKSFWKTSLPLNKKVKTGKRPYLFSKQSLQKNQPTTNQQKTQEKNQPTTHHSQPGWEPSAWPLRSPEHRARSPNEHGPPADFERRGLVGWLEEDDFLWFGLDGNLKIWKIFGRV